MKLEQIKIGMRVFWKAGGKVARIEHRTGKLCSGIVIGFSEIPGHVQVNFEFQSMLSGGTVTAGSIIHAEIA